MRLGCLLCLLCFCASVQAQTKLQTYQQYVEKTLREWKIPGLAIAVVQNGRPVWYGTYGVKDVSHPEKIDVHTKFKIASLSKSFAASLAVKLDRLNFFSLETPMKHYVESLDDYPQRPWDLITPFHLLSHSSGFKKVACEGSVYSDISFPALLKQLNQEPMNCEVGTCYRYQNFVYSLIKPALETATGLDYCHLMRTYITEPLKMHNTLLNCAQWEEADNKALGHVAARVGQKSGFKSFQSHPYYDNILPAGGVASSVFDMSVWIQAQLNQFPEVLSAADLKRIHEPVIQTKVEMARFSKTSWRKKRLKDAYYGLGWRIYHYEDHPILYHGGFVQGFMAVIAVIPDKQTGVVILTNSATNVPSLLAAKFLDLALDLPPEDWSQITLQAHAEAVAVAKRKKAQRAAAQKRNKKRRRRR